MPSIEVICLEWYLHTNSGLNPYYGLVEIALKYDIFKKVSTRIEMPNGTKVYESVIYKEPEKYFTDDIMKQLEKAVAKEFKYGSSADVEEEVVEVEDTKED